MALCPFDKEECTPECAMFAKGVQECGFSFQGQLTEEIHDMLVELRESFAQQPSQP